MSELKISKRLVAGVLAVLALLTLFLDFGVLTSEAMAQMGLLTDPSAFAGMLNSMFGLSLYAMGDTGTAAYRLFTRIARILNGGGVSILEARTLISVSNRLMNLQGDGDAGLAALLVLLTLFIALTFLAGVYALVGIARRRRARGFWLAGMLLALLIIEGMLVTAINSNGYVSLAVLTAWPFVGFVLAVGSIYLCYTGESAPLLSLGRASSDRFSSVSRAGWPFRGRSGGRASRASPGEPERTPVGDIWDCPRCGKTSEPGARFCSVCGAARPRKRYCAQCGHPCKDDAVFCSWCGVRLEDSPIGFDAARSRPIRPFQSSDDRVPNGTHRDGAPAGVCEVPNTAPDPSSSPMLLTVEAIENRNGVNRTFQVNLSKSLIIRRSPACDLQIHDQTVSGTHLRIDREDGGLYVTDLNSCNGTILNGTLLTERAALNSNDRLAIGLTQLRVRWASATA